MQSGCLLCSSPKAGLNVVLVSGIQAKVPNISVIFMLSYGEIRHQYQSISQSEFLVWPKQQATATKTVKWRWLTIKTVRTLDRDRKCEITKCILVWCLSVSSDGGEVIVHGPHKNLVPMRGTKPHVVFLIGLFVWIINWGDSPAYRAAFCRPIHKKCNEWLTNYRIPGNAVPTVKITLGTLFPGVPTGNDPCCSPR